MRDPERGSTRVIYSFGAVKQWKPEKRNTKWRLYSEVLTECIDCFVPRVTQGPMGDETTEDNSDFTSLEFLIRSTI